MKRFAAAMLGLCFAVCVIGCGGQPASYEPPVNTGNGGENAAEDPTSDAGVGTDDSLMTDGAGQ
ncbi:MAG: hypothetical protein Fues2KO_20610 [Fuerstiella sp.]